MSDESRQEADAVAPGAGPEDAADEASKDGEPRKQGSGGPILVLILVLLAAAAGGWYWVTRVHGPEMAARDARIDALEQALAGMGPRLDAGDAASAQIEATQVTVSGDLAAFRQALDDVGASVSALYAKEANESIRWVLSEAEYLVLAATQRLALERDVRTAIAALKAADARLRSAEHPDLIALREQLASDIAALEGVQLPDVEGLAIYLADAIGRVDGLPTKPIAELDMSFSRMRAEEATPENWQGYAKAVWADIVSLIEIKDGELPDGVLFDPELRYFLQQNLRLELASARLAVLRHDNANFRAAASLIVSLLEQYYDVSDASVAALIDRMNEGQSLDLDPEVPSITASLDALRAMRLSTIVEAASGIAAKD